MIVENSGLSDAILQIEYIKIFPVFILTKPLRQIHNDILLHLSRDLANKIVRSYIWNNLMQIASITRLARDQFCDKSVRQHESLVIRSDNKWKGRFEKCLILDASQRECFLFRNAIF